MKKILSIIAALGFCLGLKAQTADSYFAGTLTTPSGGVQVTNADGTLGWVYLVTTNRANVHSVQVSSASTGILRLYDSGTTNSPFWGIYSTNAAYWTTASYSTNFVTTYISPLTATTNIFTNKGVYTYFVTNAASTTYLNAQYAAAYTANIASISQPLTQVFAQGIVLEASTNVNWTIGYTP